MENNETQNNSNDTEAVPKYGGGITTNFLEGINMELVAEVNKVNLINKSTSIKEVRDKLTKVTAMIARQADQIEFQQFMGVERQLPKEALHQAQGFFIPDFEYNKVIFADILRDKSFGLVNENGTPTFSGRFIYPVHGFNREVLGYIGYDKYHETKYLLAKTTGFGKNTMFYGMHLMRWIYTVGYIVVVEGIVEAIYLWTIGIPAISLNGNTLTEFTSRILKRFGYNVIFVPDNDETGARAIQYWLKMIPEASTINITVGKDLDDYRKEADIQKFIQAIEKIRKSALIKMPLTITV